MLGAEGGIADPSHQPVPLQPAQDQHASEVDQSNKRLRSPTLAVSGDEPSSKISKDNRGTPADRNQAVEVSNISIKATKTRRELASIVEKIKPPGCKIKEVLKTNDNRFLVFGESTKDYNLLLLSDRWSTDHGIVTTKIAPRSGGGKAVVIHDCDPDIEVEEIIEAMRSQGYAPSNGNRLRRAANGAPTRSVKVWIDDESKINKLVESSFFYLYKKHSVTRYAPPRFQQCYNCQSLEHRSNNCSSTTRVCMRCTGDHHHRECLAAASEYRCANCKDQHASNDSRCIKIKEAIARITPQSGPTAPPTNPAVTPPTPVSLQQRQQERNSWGTDFPGLPSHNPLAGMGLATRNDLTDIVNNAVGTAVRKEIEGVVPEIAKALGAEFRLALATVTQNFTDCLDRYRKYICELEEVMDRDHEITTDQTLPPGPGEEEANSDVPSAGRTETSTKIPRIIPEEESISISIPQAAITIQKGQRASAIEKMVKSQLKTRIKILEDEVRGMLPEIHKIYHPFAARSPIPRRHRQNSTAEPQTSDSESEASTAAGRRKKAVTKKSGEDRLKVFKIPAPVKTTSTATKAQQAPIPALTISATTSKPPAKILNQIR